MRAKIPASMKSLEVDIETLNIDPHNARRRDDIAIEQIMHSLKRFGQRRPLVVRRDGMTVEAGNGRLEAARRLGWKKIAAVITDDDATTAAAYALADNKTADMASWDNKQLAQQLDDLFNTGPDAILGIGFDDDDLARLLVDASETSILDIAPPQAAYADGSTDEDYLEERSETFDSEPAAEPIESNVRMVQLFYDEEQAERFTGAAIALSQVYETTNTTETALQAVLMEAEK